MARPKSSEPTLSVTGRISADLVRQLDEIAEAIFANRTAILQECLKLGIEEFKKRRPEILEAVKAFHKRSAKK